MALQSQSRPEPMNATPHHSKVKVSVTLSDPFYIAGDAVTGKMELESRADKGLGLGIIMVELVAIEELTSRDHSATSTFLHTRRIFQGPGLPPSNAVLPHPITGEPPLPAHHHRARRGLTTFLFRLPLPPSSPPSIDFGNGLARIRYEVRASVGVAWKDQNRLVTDKCPVDVLQQHPGDGGLDFDTWPAPEGLVVGEGGKIWVQGRVLGGMLVSGESACVELQVKNHSAKKTTGLHVTLSRHLHLPAPASGTSGRLPPPLQISDSLTSVSFRGPEYITHPGTEGIAQLVFDVPRTARTVSAYPRHGGDVDDDEDEDDTFRRKTAPLFEIRGVLAIRIVMPVGCKDVVLELPVAVFHPATLPPPAPEPYPYPAPDAYSDPYPNHRSSASPPPLPLPGPTPNLYADRAQSPFYVYPAPPPALPFLPQQVPAPPNTQLFIPPYRAYDGQLWFPSPPPAYVDSPYYDQYPPPRSASANIGVAQASILPAGLPVSVTPDHIHSHLAYQQQGRYPPQPEQTIGHGARAARISHHLRATSRARSASPPAQITPPTPVAVDVVSPKPMLSPKIVTETQGATDTDDLFAQSFGRTGTRVRSLSVVKLEEMVARAAAETEAVARAEKEGREFAIDKTLPVPPVPSGKPSSSGLNLYRRAAAQEIFRQLGPDQGREEEAGVDMVPRTPSLSALSLLRPPPRRDGHAFLSSGDPGGGLDALERRLVEQVGTRKPPPLPPPDVRSVLEPMSSPEPPPPPVPVPVPVPGKSMAQEQQDGVGMGATFNESAISSLALAAEEDFGGRNAQANLALLDAEGEAEDEAEGEDADADADGRTQHQGKGAGASSSSERGTYKARSRKSAKSDSKERDRERGKEKKAKQKKDKREARDDDAVRLKRAAKGRVAEWLGKLEACEAGPGPVTEPDISMGPALSSSLEPPMGSLIAPDDPTSSPTVLPVIESKPNPRSSGFVPVSTLRRAPISLPPALDSAPPPSSDSTSTPRPPSNAMPAPLPVQLLAHRYPRPSQVEVKYDVKSARGGRGGRVTAVAAIWAESSRVTDSGTGPGSGSGTTTPRPWHDVAAERRPPPKANAAQTKAAAPNKPLSAPVPVKPMTSIVDADKAAFPVRVAPPGPARTPRPRQQQQQHLQHSAAAATAAKEKDALRPPRARFGLGAAAAATPSSPALSSSIAIPVLSSTASLARPPLTTTTATTPSTPGLPPPAMRDVPPPSSSPLPTPPLVPPVAGQRVPPIVNGGGAGGAGGGFKAEFAFGQARLRDLIKRYQGQPA